MSTFAQIRLRALEPEDLSLLYTIENDPESWDVSASSTPISKYALKQYLALQPQDIYQSSELRLVIETIDDVRPIGLLDLTEVSFRDGRAEVGIALLRQERGYGYALSALSAAETYAREYLHLRFLYAQVSFQTNPKSKILFERAEYKCVAVLPDWRVGKLGVEDVVIFQKKL